MLPAPTPSATHPNAPKRSRYRPIFIYGIKMRTISTLTVAALAGTAVAFAPPSTQLRPVNVRSNTALSMEYIPSGLSAAEWKRIKEEERKKKENLGKMGPQRFKSRSFQVGRRAAPIE